MADVPSDSSSPPSEAPAPGVATRRSVFAFTSNFSWLATLGVALLIAFPIISVVQTGPKTTAVPLAVRPSAVQALGDFIGRDAATVAALDRVTLINASDNTRGRWMKIACPQASLAAIQEGIRRRVSSRDLVAAHHPVLDFESAPDWWDITDASRFELLQYTGPDDVSLAFGFSPGSPLLYVFVSE